MNDKILNCCDEISLLLKQNDIIISYLKIRDEITSNKDFIKKINGKSFFSRPRILICCPSNITQVEKNAIKEAAERTGAKKKKKCTKIEENEDSIKIYNEVNSSLIYADYLNKKEQAYNLIDEMKEIIKK